MARPQGSSPISDTPPATFESPDASWSRLKRVLDGSEVALFVGAGLTIPSRIPSWSELTARLAGVDDKRVAALEAKRIGLTTQLQIASQKHQATWQWIESVREALYRDFLTQVDKARVGIPGLTKIDFGSRNEAARARVRQFFTDTNPLLSRLVGLCSREHASTGAKDRIGTIVTTNLDGLLQVCDRACHGSPRMLRTIERASKNSDFEKISLYHLHGYLHVTSDRPDEEAADRLVLTEHDYLERTDNPYSWANVVLHWALREFPIIFIGCSMTDELVRRALRRSMRERLLHYQSEHPTRLIPESRWRRQFALVQWKPKRWLNEAVNANFAFLGVWPLWVKNFRKDVLRRMDEVGLRTS